MGKSSGRGWIVVSTIVKGMRMISITDAALDAIKDSVKDKDGVPYIRIYIAGYG